MRLARAFLSLSLLQIPKASSSFALSSPTSKAAAASSFMTTTTTTTTTMTRNANIQKTKMFSTSTTETEKVTIFGGDYAGHSATFSSIDGALIPVPNHYVPEAMVEWGQVPNGLECIVSEDLVEAENENDAKQMWERNVVTIMPEVGCGLDNLDTMKNQQFIPNENVNTISLKDVKAHAQVQAQAQAQVGVATAFLTDAKRRVECIFVVQEDNKDSDNGDYDDNTSISVSTSTTTRYRISINLHENNQLRSPIDMTKERKTSDESSKGTIAKGGGLDSRTVARLIGKEDFNKPFCNGNGYDVSRLEGKWTISNIDIDGKEDGNGSNDDDDGDDEIVVERGSDYWNNDNVSTFSLPGNILVRFCKSSCLLEISLLQTSTGDDNDDDDDDSFMNRIVVTRNLEDDADGNVEYSMETKKG
uniref:Plastid lipid-associated protein/fibrillin conserved domain-containing protein n=1 Tax=Chaetoceros debilis TaxID=122233 RepID=A0A7S3VCY4_9STRA